MFYASKVIVFDVHGLHRCCINRYIYIDRERRCDISLGIFVFVYIYI